jgi:replicative DNA helicase
MEVHSFTLKRKLSDLEIMGKIPPQAIELEEAVIGAILLEKEALPIAMDILNPQSFYLKSHQMIFKSILWLFEHNLPVDMLTVSEQLKKDGNLESIGGPAFISGLTLRVASSAHIEYHSKIIEQKHIQRQLIDVASKVLEKAFDQSSDVNDLIDYNENELFKVTQGRLKKDTLVVNELLKSAIDRIVSASKKSTFLTGVPSGFSNINKVTLGWQPTDLIIVAARPSMGKTAFVLSMASSMAISYKKSVAIFSLEM